MSIVAEIVLGLLDLADKAIDGMSKAELYSASDIDKAIELVAKLRATHEKLENAIADAKAREARQ